MDINTNGKINQIIRCFLDKKGSYKYLVPIEYVTKGYVTDRGVKFEPHPDYPYKKRYDVKDDLRDEEFRIQKIKILNSDIEKYNKWANDDFRYPHIDLYDPFSFLVVRSCIELDERFVDDRLYVTIIDKDLYYAKEKDDFIPRLNKTIYQFLKDKKEEIESEDRWSEENIYYEPFQAFYDWFAKHPSDAEPYSFDSKSETIQIDTPNSKFDNLVEKAKKKYSVRYEKIEK